MSRIRELESAYQELFGYHLRSLPVTPAKGLKQLSDGTEIATTLFETDLGIQGILVQVAGKEEVSFKVTQEGLQEYTHEGETAVSRSNLLLVPDSERAWLRYPGIDPYGTEQDRFSGAIKLLITWLRSVDTKGIFTPPPVEIRPRINTFAAARRLERLLMGANPRFRI